MTRELILKSFSDNVKQFQKYARNIGGEQDGDDLFQECALMVLEFEEERLIGYWNPTEGLKPFFLRMLKLQYHSKTSYFHAKYRKENQFIQSKGKDILYNAGTVDIEEPEVDRMVIDTITDNLHVCKAAVSKDKQISLFRNDSELTIWELYVEAGSLRKTLAALPEELRDKYDLKKVHEIVKDYRKTFKSFLKIAA